MYSLRFNKHIASDIRKARQWYNEQSAGLGYKFQEVVFTCVASIAAKPLLSPERYHNIRIRRVNRKFPYFIHYEVTTKRKEVLVWGVFHGKRKPETWENRVKGASP